MTLFKKLTREEIIDAAENPDLDEFSEEEIDYPGESSETDDEGDDLAEVV